MSNLTYEKLAELFGEEFARKYMAKRRIVEEISPEELEQIKHYADKLIPSTENMHVKYHDYDIILVETPKKASLREPKPTKGVNWRGLVVWAGSPFETDFVTVFGPEDEVKKLAKRGFFYLVGKLKSQEYNGRRQAVFNAVAVIMLTEVEDSTPAEVSGPAEVRTTDEDEEWEVEEYVVQ